MVRRIDYGRKQVQLEKLSCQSGPYDCRNGPCDLDRVNLCGGHLALFLGKPFTWLEEVQTACMVWIVFSAAGAAFRMGNHVAIEMIVDLMPKALQKVMTILISVVVVAVLGYLFDKTIGFIQIFLRSGRATSMMKIPFWLIYGIAIPAYIDMIVSYFYSIWKGVKSEAKEAASVNE
jgi:TRAP-type C4-dicarboxylate transport system permease small subunit